MIIRKLTYKVILFLLLAMVSATANAMDTRTAIFHPAFRSLQVQLAGNDQLPPIMVMGLPDHIVISFDELADERRYMRYEIVHCDRNWQPDRLVSAMYMDGFNVNDVTDYSYSQATSVNYMHYRIAFPNENVRLKVSGNYLVRIYDESDPDTILLQARFRVSENTAAVYGLVSPRTDIDYQDKHQQLSVMVEPATISIDDPYRDLMVTIQQNGRVDDIRMLNAPSHMSGRQLVYEHLPALIFPAGNEYRRFETVTINYPSMNVEGMSYHEPFYHATLYVDEPRNEAGYNFDKTQHGRYRVREYNSDESDTEADYVMTHFTLNSPELPNMDIFIDGDLTNRLFDPSSRMHYNRGLQRYECSLLLKQGSYNYQYLAVPSGEMKGYTAPIEGDYYQTINEYTICAYYHKPGELYDRLIGFAHFRDKQ